MNSKTTLFLAVVLLGLVGGLWIAGGDKPVDRTLPQPPTELLMEKSLVNLSLAQVVKVTCQVPDKPEWIFERAPGERTASSADWLITAPFKVEGEPGYIGSIVRKITSLRYKVSHQVGAAGAVSAERAGLVPPSGTVTLEDDGGNTVTVELGKALGDQSSYVRLGGSDEIYEVLSGTDDILKGEALEYRGRQLVKFDRKDLTRLEITSRQGDAEASTCVVVPHGDGWQFEVPGQFEAVKAKVDSAVNALATLRVSDWVEVDPKNPGMYGLAGEPELTVRATVEGDDSVDESGPPVKVKQEYVLHISGVSPIGETNKVYIRAERDTAVGTISKSLVSRMTPDLKQWRNMQVTSFEVKAADHIALSVAGEQVAFKKTAGAWADAATETAVDQAAVAELVNQVAELKAVGFVDKSDQADATQEFNGPDATAVEFKIGEDGQSERIVIGAFTDPARKRLAYVQSLNGQQIAKVRVGEFDKLTRSLAAYRDRTIFDFLPARFEKLAITRTDDVIDGPFSFALGKVDNRLQLTEPVSADVVANEVNKLTDLLLNLTAIKVVDGSDKAGYGLDTPDATCVITYRPPEITHYIPIDESKDEASDPAPMEDEDSKNDPSQFTTEEIQPDDETYTLLVAEHEGLVYAMRADASTIYEVAPNLLDLLRAEFHDPKLLRFEASQVAEFTITDSDQLTHQFVREGSGWKYAPEPDLPMSTPRIQDVLLRLNDLTTDKFVAYAGGELSRFGLASPHASLSIRLEDGSEQRLTVSAQVCEADPAKRMFAALPDSGAIFLISSETVKRFEVNLAELEAQ